jgi:hypothetical protein
MLIIEGRIEANVGKEELIFESGSFTYFGLQVGISLKLFFLRHLLGAKKKKREFDPGANPVKLFTIVIYAVL